MIPLALDSRRRLQERRVVIERELLETDAALTRLERDLYGRCEACGGAVGRQRLLALPLARCCLDCACAGTRKQSGTADATSYEKENAMYFGTGAQHHDAIERTALAEERAINIPHQGGFLSGSFCAPPSAHAVVMIVNDAGSARHLAPLRTIARQLRSQGFATLMVDGLGLEEETIGVKAHALRIDSARAWLSSKEVGALPLVLFGMGLAAPAALISTSVQPQQVTAVIACGPFPGQAGLALERIKVPVLLIAQGDHACDLKSHRLALASLHGERDLVVVHEPKEPIAAALEIALAALTFLARESCHLRVAS